MHPALCPLRLGPGGASRAQEGEGVPPGGGGAVRGGGSFEVQANGGLGKQEQGQGGGGGLIPRPGRGCWRELEPAGAGWGRSHWV